MRRFRRVVDKIVTRSEINHKRQLVAVAVQNTFEVVRAEAALLFDRIGDIARQHADLVLSSAFEERFERRGAVDKLDRRGPVDLARPPLEDFFFCGQVRCFTYAGVPDRGVGGRHRRARLARRDCRRGGGARQHNADHYCRYQCKGDHRRSCFFVTMFHNFPPHCASAESLAELS